MSYQKLLITPELLQEEPLIKKRETQNILVRPVTPGINKDIECAIELLVIKGIDLTFNYEDWIKLGFAFASLGESGREYFHQVSSYNGGYNAQECDKKFDNCLKGYNGSTNIGSFFHACKEAGLDISKDFGAYKPQVIKLPVVPTSLGDKSKSLFVIKPGNSWIEQAKNKPTPKKLFDVLWHEGELCILFADTNLGKSILAVQIGNSISLGEAVTGFVLESPSQKVLYFDFELSDKQFELRYSHASGSHHRFSSNFLRAEIDPDSTPPDEFKSFEDYLNYSLEHSIIDTGAKVLIIDNLTYLRNETERAKDALPLMKQLKALKSKYGLSILALAHTPKRDLSKPITRNDLQGSKMLINFCDSAFSIGESHTDTSVRYIKQIKQRNTEQVYDSENVCVCYIGKPYNFLQFEFLSYGRESAHLKQITEKDREHQKIEAVELKKQGLSNIEIGKRFGVSEGAVRKWLKSNQQPEN